MKNTARFLGALFTVLTWVTAPAQSVPELINYQGQLLDANGAPLPTRDYDVEINLFLVESGGAPIWGPQKFNGQSGPGLGAKVPVVEGHFNLILGPKDTGGNDLGSVFAANSSVFIELKVGTSNPIAPRQQMLAAPYALQALQALQALTAAGLKGSQMQFFTDSSEIMRVTDAGAAIFGSRVLQFGAGIPGKEVSAGKIGYQTFTPDALDIVGAGTLGSSRKIKFWSEGGATFAGSIFAAAFIPSSDVNAKADFAPVDTAAILERVVKLPIQQWRFKTENPDVKHVGPMAQDFRAVFGLGEIPTGIATVDADGVALAAIQGLHRIVKENDAELQELKRSMAELKAQMNQLSGRRDAGAQSDQK